MLFETLQSQVVQSSTTGGGAPLGAPSRVLLSRLLGIDDDGIFVKAVLKLEP
jgi:hypothetical protein